MALEVGMGTRPGHLLQWALYRLVSWFFANVAAPNRRPRTVGVGERETPRVETRYPVTEHEMMARLFRKRLHPFRDIEEQLNQKAYIDQRFRFNT